MSTTVRFSTFPRTAEPPAFVPSVVKVFSDNESKIGTAGRDKGLSSDAVMAIVRPELVALGFAVEGGKTQAARIRRPVFFGENGAPQLQYEIDAYHSEWRCGLEIEAGRGLMGNAVYRDLVQALVMVGVNYLVLGVANGYRYKVNNRPVTSRDYDLTVAIADALYGHSRIQMPYGLAVVGY